MCNHRNDSTREGAELHDRRDVLKLAAALVAAPLVGTVASAAQSAPVRDGIGTGPLTVRGYGFASATSRMAPLQIERRALGPHDVLLDVCCMRGSVIPTSTSSTATGGQRSTPSCPDTRSSGACEL